MMFFSSKLITSRNSLSDGPIKFEDFFKLSSDCATRKWPIEKVVPFMQHSCLCA